MLYINVYFLTEKPFLPPFLYRCADVDVKSTYIRTKENLFNLFVVLDVQFLHYLFFFSKVCIGHFGVVKIYTHTNMLGKKVCTVFFIVYKL